MKPQLERVVDLVVAALSGKAKQFYDLEFDFFNEVTSISGKLKPYIKKSKPEKKVGQGEYTIWDRDHPLTVLNIGQDRRRNGKDQGLGRCLSTK
jgi:hypothetical protein